MAEATNDRVLLLIDEELKRLDRRDDLHPTGQFFYRFRDKRWIEGVYVAREIAAEHLREIRDAYTADSLARETESLGLYDNA